MCPQVQMQSLPSQVHATLPAVVDPDPVYFVWTQPATCPTLCVHSSGCSESTAAGCAAVPSGVCTQIELSLFLGAEIAPTLDALGLKYGYVSMDWDKASTSFTMSMWGDDACTKRINILGTDVDFTEVRLTRHEPQLGAQSCSRPNNSGF
jgi:hypothetical protein